MLIKTTSSQPLAQAAAMARLLALAKPSLVELVISS